MPADAILLTVIVLGVVVLWPGAVLWRLVDPAASRPVALGLGSGLGVLSVTCCYLLGRWLGTPYLFVVPAVLALGVSVLGGRRSDPDAVRRPAQSTRADVLTVLGVALAAAWPILWLAVNRWPAMPLSEASLTHPFIDEPWHLSFLADFRHHVPAQYPYVEGTPLYYHWFVYPFLAALSWLIPAEPVAMLRFVAPAFDYVLLAAAPAALIFRVTRSRWAAVGAALLVCTGAPPDLLARTDLGQPLTGSVGWSHIILTSPTTGLGMALLPTAVGLLHLALSRERVARPWLLWPLLFGMLLALGAAKSVLLPVLLCGLLVVLVLGPARARTLAALALLAAAFFVAMVLVYGAGSRNLTFEPMALAGYYVERFGPTTLLVVGLTMAAAVVIPLSPLLLTASAVVTSLRAQPALSILTGAALGGLGGSLLTSHPGLSQTAFLDVAKVTAVIAGALALADLPRLAAGRLRVGVALLALATMLVTPAVLTLRSARHAEPVAVNPTEAGGPGAITAARWVRDHSTANDVVATNVHCLGRQEPGCFRTAYLISAYAERRVVVEGWAYVPPELVGAPPIANVDIYTHPFWDPALLAVNDAVFTTPSQASVAALRERSPRLRWLVADRSFPGDLTELARVARPAFESGRYVVFEVGAEGLGAD